MEQVIERKTIPSEYVNIVVYDDDGNRVTNLRTLRSIAEGQKIIAEWDNRMNSYNLDKIFGSNTEEDYGEVD
ncbi:MAG: hypothetical protein IJ587_06095 [Synergistaceae bacterium]|nr:hypothetical protein [Synergistaceae bacterium]